MYACAAAQPGKRYVLEIPGRFAVDNGAITRGDSTQKNIALVFTGDEYFEGLPTIIKTLHRHNIHAGFFLTGRLYQNKAARSAIKKLIRYGHYLGPHSDMHLLYNDWSARDSLLVTKDSLITDLRRNYKKMEALGIKHERRLFIPPYEWWNNQVADWCAEMNVRMISFTAGVPTGADYTYPEMGARYRSSEVLIKRLFEIEAESGLNGAIILVHIGTDPRRTDKLYDRLPEMIERLRERGYEFRRIDRLLE